MTDLLIKTAREVLEDLHNGVFDNERIEDGAYEILSGVIDMAEKPRTSKIADDKLLVETPFGTLVAYSSVDSDYPGIYIDLRRDGFVEDMPVALVESTETEGDTPEGRNLITRVWGDGKEQDYTDRVIHKHIEEFF